MENLTWEVLIPMATFTVLWCAVFWLAVFITVIILIPMGIKNLADRFKNWWKD